MVAACLLLVACTQSDPAQSVVPGLVDCQRLATGVIAVEAQDVSNVNAVAPTGAPLGVRLRRLSAVSPLVTPGREPKSDDVFAGLVPFRADASGDYAVLVASFAWTDLAQPDPPRLVPPRNFEWVTVCGTRFKSGLYTLAAGEVYVVQLWDSPDREIRMLIRHLPVNASSK